MNLIRLLWLAVSLVAANVYAQDQMQYGRAYLAEGDNAAAVRSYSDALDLNPFDPVAHNNLAVAKAAQGDYQAAMDLLQRAVKLAPKRADIRNNLYRLRDWMNQDGVHQQSASRPIWQKPPRDFPALPALWGNQAARVTSDVQPQLKLMRQLHYVPGPSP